MFDFSLLDLDWIMPAIGLAETLLHGPFSGHTFYIDLETGWTGAQCEDILKEHDISIYAPAIVGDDAFFTVDNDRAEEAERLLLQAGVPLKYHLFSEHNRQYLR